MQLKNFQVQRKVVVCGDGACGKHNTRYLLAVLRLSVASRRQDLIIECLHQRLLHASLVCFHLPYICTIVSSVYDSEPTVFENYVHDIYVDDALVELSLWDTAGTSSAHRLEYVF